MRSPPSELLGEQLPQIVHLPDGAVSHDAATEAIELGEQIGLVLDEAQRFGMDIAMSERDDGKWACFQFADFEPRQNGKSDKIVLRELYGLFLADEPFLLHTAHEFPTANETFLRVAGFVENIDWLRRKVLRVRYANGEQGVEMRSGARLKFRARTGGSGRGFDDAALVVYDEGQHLAAEHMAASSPTMAVNPNPQQWVAGSGGFTTSAISHSIRRRALVGARIVGGRIESSGGRFGYTEHTAERPVLVKGRVESQPVDVADRRNWARANPTLGRRISWAYMEEEFLILPAAQFAREHLGIWDPEPLPPEERETAFSSAEWQHPSNIDETNEKVKVAAFGIHLSRDGRSAAIGFCAGIADERRHIGVMEWRPGQGTGWLIPRVAEIRRRMPQAPIAVNPRSDAAQLIVDLKKGGALVETNAQEWAAACGALHSDVREHRVRYRRQGSLDDAVACATWRNLSGARAFDADEDGDITCLVAVTLAHYAHRTALPEGETNLW